MKNILTPYMLLLVAALMISSCGGEDDVIEPGREVIITYEVTAIGPGAGASGQRDFCDRRGFRQVAEGMQSGNSPLYTATFGIDPETDSVFGPVQILVVGNDRIRDTLLSTTTSILENVRLISEGSPNVDPYVDILIGYEGRVYGSVFWDYRNREVGKSDVNATQEIEFVVDETLLCDYSRYLIIESRLRYDGFVYNTRDYTDSIRIEGFRATIFNNSF